MIYLDNAATTPVCAAAAEAVYNILTQTPGNPSSLYKLGLEAEQKLNKARLVVSRALGCSAAEVYFTASGTEANNIALLGAARARRAWGNEIVITGYEHPSVHNTVMALKREGFTVHKINPDQTGVVDAQSIVQAVNRNTALVSCMHVNNETGAMLDVEHMALAVKAANQRTAFHCDAVQSFCKHPLTLNGAIDTVAVSGHKVHAPKGIGALYIRKGFHIEPVMYGGSQERGMRSGTENVAYAAGFAAAIADAGSLENNLTAITALAQLLRRQLEMMGGILVNSPEGASPYILNFSVSGIKSETVLHFLEQRNIYVSSGSACAKGGKSHTLVAMGFPDSRIDSAIRVSLCSGNTADEVNRLIEGLHIAQQTLAKS